MLVILLNILVGLELPKVPYLDTENIFHANYTGQHVEGTPMVAFTNIADSLNVDSLLEIYPSVVSMDSLAFVDFVKGRLNE